MNNHIVNRLLTKVNQSDVKPDGATVTVSTELPPVRLKQFYLDFKVGNTQLHACRSPRHAVLKQRSKLLNEQLVNLTFSVNRDRQVAC